jgi:hypothetical protein
MDRLPVPGDRAARIRPALQVCTPPGESLQVTGVPHLRCSDCNRDIFRATALNPETGQCALYFCGLGCFRQWLTTQEWSMTRPRR